MRSGIAAWGIVTSLGVGFQSLDAKAQQAEQEIQIYSQRALQAK